LVITASVEWHLGASDEPVNTFLAKMNQKQKLLRNIPFLPAHMNHGQATPM
jgi:hypothetical protein